MPTSPAMIKYAEDLIEKCGYDINDYDLENMQYNKVVMLIDELKEELGLDKERASYHAKRRE